MSHEHLADLSTSPTRCSHLTLGNPKSHFSTLLLIYFGLSTLPQKKTHSNCCTAALAVHLLLFSASYYLHNLNTASGARYWRSACIDTDMLRLAQRAYCEMGWISAQRDVLCDWPRSKKKHVLMQNVVTLHWTLAVTLLAWHSSCHTSQPVLFRATDHNR